MLTAFEWLMRLNLWIELAAFAAAGWAGYEAAHPMWPAALAAVAFLPTLLRRAVQVFAPDPLGGISRRQLRAHLFALAFGAAATLALFYAAFAIGRAFAPY